MQQRIQVCEQKYHRTSGSVSLLAVSKTHAPTPIAILHGAGQQSFAENYLQEALVKISALQEKRLIWHYIGPIQSKKAKDIAQNFSWVQTVCRLKEAKLLSWHRSFYEIPLNICIQIKLDDNPKKSGISIEEAPALVDSLQSIPHLKLRGFMTIPPFAEDFERQREYYRVVYNLFATLNAKGAQLDTLSMGMTHDFEAAIAEGATIIRIGTGLFGPR
jgi:pyridoxal phosphate enzyme (YggS family)